MNANASPGVTGDADIAAQLPLLTWVAVGLLVSGTRRCPSISPLAPVHSAARPCPTCYPTSMSIKTSVYLDDVDKRRLAALASRTGISEAELLRRGLRLLLDQAEPPRPRVGLMASADGRAAADEHLLDGFGQR